MKQVIGQSIIDKMWASISYRNLLLFGVVPALPIMLTMLIMNMPTAIDHDLIFDFLIALPIYASISVVLVITVMGTTFGMLFSISWLLHVINKKRTQHVANVLLTDDFLMEGYVNRIQTRLQIISKQIENNFRQEILLRLQEINKPLFRLQIQELEEKHMRETRENRERISHLEKEVKQQANTIHNQKKEMESLKMDVQNKDDRISALEENVGDIIKEISHSTDNQENAVNLDKSKKFKYKK